MTGACGMNRDIGAAIAERHAQRKRLGFGVSDVEVQVITVGSERPVRPGMPGMPRANSIKPESAACGS